MPSRPLGEVFGFAPGCFSERAVLFRNNRLCPFNNRVPSCTKDKAQDPLGVCSVWENEHLVITCPVRFRENWIVATNAASFFFPQGSMWTSLSEVTLHDQYGKSVGNIDLVLVSYDKNGQVIDFGAVEIQAVYISGNIRLPFEMYMENPEQNHSISWTHKNYPRPDYLSSSRKRLAPQLIYKGGIMNSWQRKVAVALNTPFFNTLPALAEVPQEEADMAWFLYDLDAEPDLLSYRLTLHRTVYTKFQASLNRIASPEPGPVEEFMSYLQGKLSEKLETPPDPPRPLDLTGV